LGLKLDENKRLITTLDEEHRINSLNLTRKIQLLNKKSDKIRAYLFMINKNFGVPSGIKSAASQNTTINFNEDNVFIPVKSNTYHYHKLIGRPNPENMNKNYYSHDFDLRRRYSRSEYTSDNDELTESEKFPSYKIVSLKMDPKDKKAPKKESIYEKIVEVSGEKDGEQEDFELLRSKYEPRLSVLNYFKNKFVRNRKSKDILLE
jgi:hypothetical protein